LEKTVVRRQSGSPQSRPARLLVEQALVAFDQHRQFGAVLRLQWQPEDVT
jgi:hypothetical protein